MPKSFLPYPIPQAPAAQAGDGARALGRAVCLLTLFLALACLLGSCSKSPSKPSPHEKVTILYWEKWTGFEADTMRRVIEKFNRSQERVQVEYVPTSKVEQKFLIAAAGGNPPDVVGLYDNNLVVYSELGALLPLDRFMKRDHVSMDDYLPVIGEACRHRGFTWALPSVPSSLALHYNKKLFREAGLDPERPPRTIAELNDYAQKLTKRDAEGHISQLGFSPAIPGWWNPMWGIWFGADLVKDGRTIAAASPESLRMMEWIQSFPKLYGLKPMQDFQASGGNFASSENAFIAGRVGMQLQGVYMFNYIEKYNPKLEWAVAPFPGENEKLSSVTLVQSDVLAIPKGAAHPEEAWQFVRFVQRQENLEQLALEQRKFPPLKATSEAFYAKHPNPYIRLFLNLANSPGARIFPKTAIQQEYFDEFESAFDEVWMMRKSPKEAMEAVTARIQPRLDRLVARWKKIEKSRLEEWAAQ